jgi:hypothetical protein
MDEKQMEAAKRVLNLIPVWDRDDKPENELLNDIYNSISINPTETINYLLDIIEDLQA